MTKTIIASGLAGLIQSKDHSNEGELCVLHMIQYPSKTETATKLVTGQPTSTCHKKIGITLKGIHVFLKQGNT